jgi:hypothetical protein
MSLRHVQLLPISQWAYFHQRQKRHWVWTGGRGALTQSVAFHSCCSGLSIQQLYLPVTSLAFKGVIFVVTFTMDDSDLLRNHHCFLKGAVLTLCALW